MDPQQNPASDPIYGYLLADPAFTAAVKKQDVAQAASAAAKIVKVGFPGHPGRLHHAPDLQPCHAIEVVRMGSGKLNRVARVLGVLAG